MVLEIISLQVVPEKSPSILHCLAYMNLELPCFQFSMSKIERILHLFFLLGVLDEQGSHRLVKYLNIQDCLEKSLKIKFALKSTRKTPKGLEKSVNLTFYRRIQQFFWRPKSVSNCGVFIWCSI